MSVSKKTRFEVFKRDKFTCQYCGRSAPDVVLQADHIEPKSKKGSDDILNLITSCFDCNSGKSDRVLSDDSVIQKKKAQLDALQERREQIEMMLQWQRELMSLDDETAEAVAQFWSEIVAPFGLTDSGMTTLKRWLKDYTVEEIMEAMRTAASKYVIYENNKPTDPSVNNAFNKVIGVCVTTRRSKDRPYLRDLYYARAVLRNNLSYVNEQLVMRYMIEAVEAGVDPERIKRLSTEVQSWSQFKNRLWELTAEVE